MTLEARVSHITNPDYPAKSRSRMTEEKVVDIIPNNDDITQIRLDFIEFEMDQGQEDEPCKDQYIEVALPDEAVHIGKLCGYNEDQHLYIHLPPWYKEPIRVKLYFRGSRKRYKYNVKVRQLDKTRDEDRELMAPLRCQQYYQEVEGNVRLFNIKDDEDIFTNDASYQRNLRYTLCFKRPDDYCKINFVNLGMRIAQPGPTMGGCFNEENTEEFGCHSDCFEETLGLGDFLQIPGGMYSYIEGDATEPLSTHNQIFCGHGLAYVENVVRVEKPGPVSVSFLSDNDTTEYGTEDDQQEIEDLGWLLTYKWDDDCSVEKNA